MNQCHWEGWQCSAWAQALLITQQFSMEPVGCFPSHYTYIEMKHKTKLFGVQCNHSHVVTINKRTMTWLLIIYIYIYIFIEVVIVKEFATTASSMYIYAHAPWLNYNWPELELQVRVTAQHSLAGGEHHGPRADCKGMRGDVHKAIPLTSSTTVTCVGVLKQKLTLRVCVWDVWYACVCVCVCAHMCVCVS